MIIQVQCEHCGGKFESDGQAQSEFCPRCGKETRIIVASRQPQTTPESAPPPAAGRRAPMQFRDLISVASLALLLAIVGLLTTLVFRGQRTFAPAEFQYSTFRLDINSFGKHTLSFGDFLESSNAPAPVGQGPFTFYSTSGLLNGIGRDGWDLVWTDGNNWVVKRVRGTGRHDFFAVDFTDLDALTNSTATPAKAE